MKKELRIGTVVELPFATVKVEEMGNNRSCQDCFFYRDYLTCRTIEKFMGKCTHQDRKDGEDIIFVEVTEFQKVEKAFDIIEDQYPTIAHFIHDKVPWIKTIEVDGITITINRTYQCYTAMFLEILRDNGTVTEEEVKQINFDNNEQDNV